MIIHRIYKSHLILKKQTMLMSLKYSTSTDGKYWYVVIANNNRSKNLTKDEYKQRINWSLWEWVRYD